MADFKYFAGPRAEMSDLLPGERPCGICGRDGPCFSLGRALEAPPGATTGCFECLRSGRFGFSHITEVGYLDADGLTTYDEEPEPQRLFVAGDAGAVEVRPGGAQPVAPPVAASKAAMEELRRTPDFPTWNEVAWPVHCADFMVYLGTWQPREIRAEAAERGIRDEDLLEAMAGSELRMPSDPTQIEWGVTFHAFRCSACATLRGVVDLD